MKIAPKLILNAIGAASIIAGCLGLRYSFSILSMDLSFLTEGKDVPKLYPVIYSLSAICVACYLGLILTGIQLIRKKTKFIHLMAGIFIIEIILLSFSMDIILLPEFGIDYAIIPPIATAGMMYQFIILFPLWSIVLGYWAKKRYSEDISI